LQFSTDEEKINFAMTYLSGVAQDWFEVTLQQEDLGYAQSWLFTWHLFVEELRVHFRLSDPVGDAAKLRSISSPVIHNSATNRAISEFPKTLQMTILHC